MKDSHTKIVYFVALNGGWSDWSEYGPCRCETNTETRTRECNSPLPSRGALNCTGEAFEAVVLQPFVYEVACLGVGFVFVGQCATRQGFEKIMAFLVLLCLDVVFLAFLELLRLQHHFFRRFVKSNTARCVDSFSSRTKMQG